jgi:hypothetical protein
LAVAAVTFNISAGCSTKGAVNNSTVAFAPTAFVLNRLYTVLPLVIVAVIVSALPVSSDTNIDLNILVVRLGAVYSVVALLAVRSSFAFT